MANIGQAMFRFYGALTLAVGATVFDHPRLLTIGEFGKAAGVSRQVATTAPVVVAARSRPEVRITPGKRAYGIRINDVASLAGMVQPNSRVDIMVVMDDPRRTGRRVAKMFMTNMRVLAISAARERAQDGRPVSAAVASIEVTPEEAKVLAIAAAQGTIRLVLRGYGDLSSTISDVTVESGIQTAKPIR